jgi:hypothetical protein
MRNSIYDDKLLGILSKKLNKSEKYLKEQFSKKAGKDSTSPKAVFCKYLKDNKIGYSNFLNKNPDEKESIRKYLQNETLGNPVKNYPQKRKIIKKRVIINDYIQFNTVDNFVIKHLKEISMNYHHGSYTSALLLARKVIENLIIQILINKYPSNSKTNKELYFDLSKNRFLDFSIVLKNLFDKRNDFGQDNTVITSLYQKCKNIKGDLNDKTHSLYHIVESKSELDNLHLQTIFDLITKLL